MGLFDSFLNKSRASKSEISSSSKGKASECQADSDNTGQSVEANARPSDTVAEKDLAAKNSPAIPAADQSVQPPGTSVTEGSLPSPDFLQVFQQAGYLADLGSRKVSDKTIQSADSELTSATICRHPSQRTSTPIILPDQRPECQNPFDENAEGVERLPSSDPFSDPLDVVNTRHERQPSSEYDDAGPEFSGSFEHEHTRRPQTPFITRHSVDGSLSQGSSDLHTCSNGSDWSTCVDQHTATIAFNELAPQLNLEPLPQNQSSEGPCGRQHPSDEMPCRGEEKLSKRRSTIFGRIRSIRSSFHLKARPSIPHERSLRRRKTFAHLPNRSYEMCSLRGKSLETLARLGGHSFLNLPADFVPATLRLPSCFVATVTYLRYFGPTVRNLFVDAGDLKVAARTYAYFADQVASAEKDQEKIELTVRSDRIPMELVQVLEQEGPRRNASHVLGVAWAFKALLAGLPAGLLGSEQLYQVLVNISYGRLLEGEIPARSGLGGFSPSSYAKIKAIALAFLALSNALQLSLICAVFGLCAVLLHESQRHVSQQGIAGSIRANLGAGLLSVERLGGVFGPLLTGSADEGDHALGNHSEREVESQRVAEMLVRNWRGVSRQLRIWESRGPIGQQGAFSWISRTGRSRP
ncbi:hypothetical protein ATEIFO6365_0002007900 [Aspergillus terreus]|uniref:Uncharacterized protein n=1 Tax=Aspergillus terreus TaxID=33178 RepID=A0A5M3YUS0_ASPTE|nr:hypothetical protein ATETN484_0004007900 [Aspergillus terreus]GFF12969.1 hypothetical protein ATEIFO6365_0002007900 [Aspergillus terreus]